MVTKIRTLDADDDTLVEACKRETKCGDCSRPEWITHQDRDKITPPEGTMAVVVDVRNNIGAIRIIEVQSNEYLGGVGLEDNGYLVLVPWQGAWRYFCTGSPRVGCIVKKQ